MTYIRSSERIVSVANRAFIGGVMVMAAAAAPAAAGCQSGNSANNTTTFLLATSNCQATATGNSAAAVGAGALAPATWTTAVGNSAYARGVAATALGYGAGPLTGSVDGATMIGTLAGRGGAGTASTAVGGGNSVGAGMSSAAHAFGGYSVAIGGGDHTTFSGARANGFRSIAVGQKSASADFGTSVGFNTNTGFASTAIGTDAQATADSSTALGRFANASGHSALALGQGAVASRPRSVALGTNSLANVADTVSVGTNTARRRIVNLAPAVANSDAVTFAQAKALASAAAQAEIAAAAGSPLIIADLRRELADLRASLKQQQQELAELKGGTRAALQQ